MWWCFRKVLKVNIVKLVNGNKAKTYVFYLLLFNLVPYSSNNKRKRLVLASVLYSSLNGHSAVTDFKNSWDGHSEIEKVRTQENKRGQQIAPQIGVIWTVRSVFLCSVYYDKNKRVLCYSETKWGQQELCQQSQYHNTFTHCSQNRNTSLLHIDFCAQVMYCYTTIYYNTDGY